MTSKRACEDRLDLWEEFVPEANNRGFANEASNRVIPYYEKEYHAKVAFDGRIDGGDWFLRPASCR